MITCLSYLTSIWNTICHERIMWLKMPYGIGMKPEYDMKPENEHEHEKQYVMITEGD